MGPSLRGDFGGSTLFHKRRSDRWILTDDDMPSADALRQMPELAGLENNPWLRIFKANKAGPIEPFTAADILVRTLWIFAFLLATTRVCFVFLTYPDWLNPSELFLYLWIGSVNFCMVGHYLGNLQMHVSGNSHVEVLTSNKSRDLAVDLHYAAPDPRWITLATIGINMRRMPPYVWNSLAWFLGFAHLPIIPAMFIFQSRPLAYIGLIPSAMIVGFCAGIAGSYPQFVLHMISHSVDLYTTHRKDEDWGLQIMRMMARGLLWITRVGLLTWGFCYGYYVLVTEHEWPNIFLSKFMGIPVILLYAGVGAVVSFLRAKWLARRARDEAEKNFDTVGAACISILDKAFGEPVPPRTGREIRRERRRKLWRGIVDPIRARPARTLFVSLPIWFFRTALVVFVAGYAYLNTDAFEQAFSGYPSWMWRLVVVQKHSLSDSLLFVRSRSRGDLVMLSRATESEGGRLYLQLYTGDLRIFEESKGLIRESDRIFLGLNASRWDEMSSILVAARIADTLELRSKLDEFTLEGGHTAFGTNIPLDFSGSDQLRSVNLIHWMLSAPVTLPPRLDALRITECSSLGFLQPHPETSTIRMLWMSDTSIGDIAEFLRQPGIVVQKLQLYGFHGEGDLSCLAEQPKIESLSLRHSPSLTSVEVLAQMKSLERVLIEECDFLTNIRPLGDCPNLKSVQIRECGFLAPEEILVFENSETLRDLVINDVYVLPRVNDWNSSKSASFRDIWDARWDIETEARNIEARVRWSETLRKAIEELKNKNASVPSG